MGFVAMSAHLALIDELNDAVAHGSAERRAAVLKRVTDLFAFGAEGYSGEQIILFDDVFNSLVVSIEGSARATLANRLANIPNAPPAISRALASDDAINVAASMLEHSEALDSAMLVEQARTKSQQHLLAISRRKSLDTAITDVLVERGDKPVVMSMAGNPGAAFSEAGFTMLIRRSHGDDELAISVGLRRDIPRHHLLKLLVRASHAVRLRLDSAHLMATAVIQSAVADAASAIQSETGALSRNFLTARAHVDALRTAGHLDEAEVESFAKMGKFEETTAGLAILCDLPIATVERAMVQERPETVLIFAKSIGMSWPTVKEILKLRAGSRGVGAHEFEQYLGTFTRLKLTTAQQVVEFQRKRALGV
jgi:uncharacterized protein (DUF2336 family)